MFKLFYVFVWTFTLLPLKVLYLFSDIFYLLIYYVLPYRKKLVRKNLTEAFPSKSVKEIEAIEKQYYRFFCDLFFETLSVMHMSENELMRRMHYSNIDVILEEYKKGNSVFLMTAHYGNWEWGISLSSFFPADKPLYSIYQKLSNKKFDAFMYNLRKTFKGEMLERNDLLRKIVQLKSENKPAMFGMISDQAPAYKSIHYWTNFLNHDTATVSGTEQLAKKFDYPVYFAKVNRIKRGYYNCEFISLAQSPKQAPENEITERYMRLLEANIESAPEYWLWSHNRWKHSPKID